MELSLPALHKQGHLVPVTALIKMVPSLVQGIRIVAFMGEYTEDMDDSTIDSMNYLLFRSDTMQVMGISEGLVSKFNIPASLMEGHPLNNDQQLFTNQIFKGSIE